MGSTDHSRALATFISPEVRSYSLGELESACSARAVRTALRTGTLVRLMRGVYVAGEHQDSFAARAHAALRWAGPRGALTGEAALFLWRAVDEAPPLIDVTLRSGTGRQAPPWIRIVYTGTPFPTAEWQSLALALPEVALIHAFGRIDPDSRESVVYKAIGHGHVRVAALREEISRTPRVRGREALLRTIKAITAGSESHLERIGSATVFNTAQLQRLLRQHKVRAEGRRHRLDFYDPKTRTAIELDGAAFHGALHQRERDLRRDAVLAAQGILTLRFGYHDVVERPGWCREIVIETLRSRQQR